MPALNRIKKWNDLFYFWDAPAHITWIQAKDSSISLTEIWETYQIEVVKVPEYSIEPISLSYASSNTNIATVNNTWLVTCVTPWECTITITDSINGYNTTVSVVQKRQPTENTMLYIPLDTDLIDHWPNSISLSTNSVSISTWIVTKRWVWNFTNNQIISWTNIDNMAHDFTISMYMKWTSTSEWFFWQWSASTNRWLHFHFSTSRWLYLWFYYNDYDSWIGSWTINDWNRHQIWCTYNASTYLVSLYIDWQKIWSKTLSSWFYAWNNTFNIWKSVFSNADYVNWYMAEIVIENAIWDDNTFSSYHNNMKKRFDLS